MDADVEAVIAPVTIRIEQGDNAKVDLGPVSRNALRIEQTEKLREALDAITECAQGAPLDDLNRSQHEDLGMWLRLADTASSAIWWLLLPDVYTDEDE